MTACISCKQQLLKYQTKYCSNLCQKENEYKVYIQRWLAGENSGNRGVRAKAISRHLVRYLKEKYKNACSQCGWQEVNPFTDNIPLEIDHIDGDADNNNESNLRLLCPNCHSLTSNFRNLNKGHGRLWRREKYVKIVNTPL